MFISSAGSNDAGMLTKVAVGTQAERNNGEQASEHEHCRSADDDI